MALNFPNTPNVNDTFNGPNNIIWQWDGVAWNAMAGSITDAPTDGRLYDRESASWLADPIQQDAPSDGNYYTRHNGTWSQGGGSNPIGVVAMYPVATPPSGWLLCDGTVYNITAYPSLYAVLGTKYGGDGVSTFAVPNYVNNFLQGATTPATIGAKGGAATVTLAIANLPAHNHTITDPGHAHTVPAHGHGFNDPGHAHSIADPGHVHGQGFVASYTSGLGSYNNMGTQTNTTSVGTGIGIYGAGTGCSVAANGPWTSGSAATGISTANVGSGTAFSILPPFTGISFIIRAL